MTPTGLKEWFLKKDANLWASVILVLFALSVSIEAYRLEIGTPSNPGSGFLIFGASTVLGILALHQLIKSIRDRERRIPEDVPRTYGRRVLAVLVILAVYIFLLAPVGYLICSFLLLCFLFRVLEKGKWVYTLRDAFLTSVISYVIFALLLQLQLPKGLLTFF
jgi:putative tricarboxylic transport membrane protein